MPKPKLVPISNKETPPALVKPEFNNKLSNYNYTLNNAIYKNIYDLKYKYASYNKRAKLLDLAYECKLINKSDKRYLYQVLNEGAEKVRHSGAVFELKDGSNIQVTVLRTSRPLYNNKENILIGTYINKDGQQKWVYMSKVPYYIQYQKDDTKFIQEYKVIDNCVYWHLLYGNSEILNKFKDVAEYSIKNGQLDLENMTDNTNYVYFELFLYSIIALYLYENVYGDEMIYNSEIQEKAYDIIDKFDKNPELFLKENINYKSEYLLNKNVSHDFGDLSPGKLPEE